TARQSYQSAFVNSGVSFTSGQLPVAVQPGNTNPGGFFGGIAHDFDPGAGVDVFQQVTIQNNARIFLSFQWDDPFFSVSGTGTNKELDIYVLNAANNTVVAGSAFSSLGNDAVEIFSFTNTTGAAANFNILILQASGSSFPSLVKYINFGNDTTTVEYDTQSYTIVGHANATGAAAVGAAFYGFTPAFGQNPPLLESFSSRGTTSSSIFYTTTGAPTSQVRQKPEFVAPDGGNTSFFGQDISFGTTDLDSFPNFFGTSAAAPHAAAVAALIQQGIPTATPSQIYTAMETTAINMDAPGYDVNSGFGLIDGVAAVNSLPRPVVNGDSNRNSLAGNNSLDLITGGSGADTLTGGLAQDTFIYSSVRDAGDLVVDFQSGIDRFDFRSLATSLGQTGQNLITNGFLSFGASGSSTRIFLDNDGVGTGFSPRPYILVQNITPASLNVASNFIF
ncbi:MAG: S8 family serine peptidase, partial [Pseudanabaenaceae cyanobacterium bins.68]|nr:S8 family serine peptidase [Pseudanabaenaceae cyanobacterium bins.68]